MTDKEPEEITECPVCGAPIPDVNGCWQCLEASFQGRDPIDELFGLVNREA